LLLIGAKECRTRASLLARCLFGGLLIGIALSAAPRVSFSIVGFFMVLAIQALQVRIPARRLASLVHFVLRGVSLPLILWATCAAGNYDPFLLQFGAHASGGGSEGMSISTWLPPVREILRLSPTIGLMVVLATTFGSYRQWRIIHRALAVALIPAWLGVAVSDWRLEYLTPILAIAIGLAA